MQASVVNLSSFNDQLTKNETIGCWKLPTTHWPTGGYTRKEAAHRCARGVLDVTPGLFEWYPRYGSDSRPCARPSSARPSTPSTVNLAVNYVTKSYGPPRAPGERMQKFRPGSTLNMSRHITGLPNGNDGAAFNDQSVGEHMFVEQSQPPFDQHGPCLEQRNEDRASKRPHIRQHQRHGSGQELFSNSAAVPGGVSRTSLPGGGASTLHAQPRRTFYYPGHVPEVDTTESKTAKLLAMAVEKRESHLLESGTGHRHMPSQARRPQSAPAGRQARESKGAKKGNLSRVEGEPRNPRLHSHHPRHKSRPHRERSSRLCHKCKLRSQLCRACLCELS